MKGARATRGHHSKVIFFFTVVVCFSIQKGTSFYRTPDGALPMEASVKPPVAYDVSPPAAY